MFELIVVGLIALIISAVSPSTILIDKSTKKLLYRECNKEPSSAEKIVEEMNKDSRMNDTDSSYKTTTGEKSLDDLANEFVNSVFNGDNNE